MNDAGRKKFCQFTESVYIRNANQNYLIPMKKLLTFSTAVLLCGNLLAGGLVTNTNQSAAWVRLPARDASTDADAVFFNPAGLMQLNNGFHFSVSNQTILQNKTVTNLYTGPGGAFGLNDPEYIGKVTAPLFPSVYATYKMDKFAFSFGFNPVGGGGGAEFERGLPSFELSTSDLVPALAPDATAYRLDAYFEGTSVYFGYQGGVSYKINDLISVFAGVRYVTGKNTYNGYLRDVELGYMGTWTSAPAIFEGFSAQATGAANGMQPLIDGGAGTLTFAQAQGASIIDAQTRATLEGGLLAFGVPQSQIDGMTLAQAQGAYQQAAATNAATATLLGDKKADVEQTASGYTPILGVNLSFSERLNIGIKYEFATELEFTNDTKEDILTGFTPEGTPVTMFPDGQKFNNDIPAMLSLGVDYGITDKLRLSLGTHYYFDKAVDYGKKIEGEYVENDQVIDDNFMEFAGGLEYRLNELLRVSAGYLLTKTGVNDYYQTDLAYSLTSNTIGGGLGISVNENFMINLGVGYTAYKDGEVTLSHEFVDGTIFNPIEKYDKDNLFIAVGLDFSF